MIKKNTHSSIICRKRNAAIIITTENKDYCVSLKEIY